MELRRATSEHHERVDTLFSRFDLSRADDYRQFLRAMATAFIPVEEALDRGGVGALIPDWSSRRRAGLLRKDLADAGAGAIEPLSAPLLAGPAALLGALYVIEGSRLGGAVLKRALPQDAPARFLSAPAEAGAWRQLVCLLDERLGAPEAFARASAAARAVFQLFEMAGRRV